MSDPTCPTWCVSKHSGDGLDLYHYAEVGQVEGGEMTVTVAITAWATDEKPDPDPAVTLLWRGSDAEDNDVYLQDGIEFSLSESEALLPLLLEANEILRTGRRK